MAKSKVGYLCAIILTRFARGVSGLPIDLEQTKRAAG